MKSSFGKYDTMWGQIEHTCFMVLLHEADIYYTNTIFIWPYVENMKA